MKMISCFLIILLVCSIQSALDGFPQKNCSAYVKGGESAFSIDFCRTTYYDSNKKCCFLQYEDPNEVTHYHCILLSETQWADIDDYIDHLEETDSDIEDVEILDCHSSYLYASLLLIFALIL